MDYNKTIIKWWQVPLLRFLKEYASGDGEGATIFYKKFRGVMYITKVSEEQKGEKQC